METKGFALAIAASAVATVLAVVFYSLFAPTPFVPFFAATAVAAWAGGLRAGVLATLLGAVVSTYLFLPPSFSLAIATVETAIRLLGFVVVCLVISVLSDRLRSARTQADDARQRAAQSENQVAAILRGINDGVTVHDAQGRIVYANDAAAVLCGFPTADALIAASARDVLSRFDVLDEAGQHLPAEQLPGRRIFSGEDAPEALVQFRVQSSGERRWSWISATAVRDADGHPELAVNCFRDITHRKVAEDQARLLARASRVLASSFDADAMLQRVAELAVPALADWCVVDLLDGTTVRRVAGARASGDASEPVNLLDNEPLTNLDAPSGAAQVMRSGQAILVRQATAPDPDTVALDPLWPAFSEHNDVRSYVVVPMTGGGRVLGAMSLAVGGSGRSYGPADLAVAQDLADRVALALDNGRLYADSRQQTHTLTHLNAALRDAVLERGDAVTRLEDTLKTRDEFLAAVAHDLKNPLAGIKATVQLLARRLKSGTADTQAISDALLRIDLTIGRASEQLDELLDLARLQMARQLDLDRHPVDLVGLAREVASDQQQRTERHTIDVESDVPALVGVWDARRLRRLLANLVDNAIKYSPHGGPIRVRLARVSGPDAGVALISVHDQGMGIPADDMPRVFDRFRRGSNVGSTIAGTGIGLASVRQVVESHGGQIGLSSSPADGTTVEIRLPLVEPISND